MPVKNIEEDSTENPPQPTMVKKMATPTSADEDGIKLAYEDVRDDNSKTEWATFKFEGTKIICSATGADFEEFKNEFAEDIRAFGYIRLQTGDEMSKRQKFLFITWIGPGVSVLQRAKMSMDKFILKNIIKNFAVELQLENPAEIDLDFFQQELKKVGGTNYGTGVSVN